MSKSSTKENKPGQPTGDVLACVIAGNNGYEGTRDERAGHDATVQPTSNE